MLKFHFEESIVALEAIEQASKVSLELFRKNSKCWQKPGYEPQQVISKADIESQDILIKILKNEFPDYSILSEELESADNFNNKIWIIDPICGSLFYYRGLSQWSISLSLVENNEVKIAIISNPFYKEIFFAEKGNGSYLNGNKVKVSNTTSINNSIVSIGHRDLRKEKYEYYTKKFLKDSKRIITMENHWSLCQLAIGRIDAIIRCEQPIYEIAAGMLLIHESGGKFTDFSGNEVILKINKERSTNYVASNGIFHESLIKLLKPKLSDSICQRERVDLNVFQ